MGLHQSEIHGVVLELRPRLVGSRLDKLHALDPYHLQLVFKTGSERIVVWLVLRPGDCRIHMTSTRREGPPQPPAWIMKLRSELSGRLVSELRADPQERIVRLVFAHPDPDRQRQLLAELFGHTPRLLLLDGEDRVLYSAIGREPAGAMYQLPATGAKPAKAPPEAVPAPDPATLALNQALESRFAELDQRQALESARRRLHKALQIRHKKTARLVERMEKDLARTQEADSMALTGEVLKAHLSSVPRGASQISLPVPWDEAHSPLCIRLDPRLDAVGNMKRLFDRARRLERGRSAISQRLLVARKELSGLAARIEHIQAAVTLEDLQADPLHAGSQGPGKDPGLALGKRPAARLPYWEYRSQSGRTILVGRSARDNHRLSFQVARGSDLWLHVQDVPGAHVLVRLARDQAVDQASLLDAASLAGAHSGFSAGDTVEIRYSLAKHVRPIKGAAPGLASVAKGKTIRVLLEPERLQRLKAIRAELEGA